MAIELVPYDPAWASDFESEAKRIADALGQVARRIDHVGSTSVPGLAAKPVIDIQVSVSSLEPVACYREPLERLGYTYATVPFPYFHKPAGWPHTHHIHVREAGGADERRTLAFRDWLRTHASDRDDYEALKRRVARNADPSTVEGRYRYSEAKTEFIRAIERRAQQRPGATAHR